MKSESIKKSGFRIFSISPAQLAVPVITGACIALISYPQGFRSLHFIPFLLLYSLSLGIPCMKVFEYTEWKLDQHVSWLENPYRRFIMSVFFELVMGILILTLVNTLFYGVVQQQGSGALLSKTSEGLTYLVISIIAGILLVNSLRFLKNWKQAAVNEEKLKREILSAEYEALKNQVNPHFLFNSLTALSSLVYKDPEKAVVFIRELSNVFRYVLESREEEVVSFARENKFLASFIYLSHIRYEDALQISNSLTDATDKFILPMALQMLLENAVKHNSIHAGKPLKVDILEENGYVVVINTLHPKKSEIVSNRVGLENIVSRYKYLSDKAVVIEKSPEQFIVKLPVLHKKHG